MKFLVTAIMILRILQKRKRYPGYCKKGLQESRIVESDARLLSVK